MSPFDFLKSINDTKKDVMLDDIDEKAYVSFVVNRSLSYFSDTVGMANVMNRYHHIDNKMQYEFLRGIVRKRKRFSKWEKPQKQNDIEVIKEYYKYSNEKAAQVNKLLTEEQMVILRAKVHKGGKTKPK